MKSFTDIDQSKALAEILSLESADMVWIDYGYCKRALPKDDVDAKIFPVIVSTWSLNALLNHLKQRYYVRLDHDGVSWSITCIEHDTDKKYTSSMFDDPVDACWGMILRLNKEELEYEKKYKNALEWARQVRDGKIEFIRKEVEEVFPELKRSEDEKIRGAIIDHLKDNNLIEWAAWLEKQGQVKESSISQHEIETCKENNDSLTSKDESIRKAIIALIEFGLENKSAIAPGYNITKEEALAWLERQESVGEIVERYKNSWYNEGKIAGMAEGLTNDEKYQQGWHDALEKQCGQKSINDTDEEIVNAVKNTSVLYMVEPKFKAGDWIVSECGNVAYVETFGKTLYYLLLKDGYHESMLRDYVDKCWRLWSIKDAKDGDVLVDKYNNIGIFKECKDIYWLSHIYLGCDDELRGFNVGPYHEQADTYPATKEQCDLLFQKMGEAGYEWNSDKNELKKIEQKPTCSEEDDRIVRDIVRILKGELNYTSKEDADKYIAWLEKRGEQEQDVRYRYLEDLIVADDIHQMAMNDAMAQEARSKAIDALSKLGVSVLLGLEKQGNEPVWCHHKVDLSDCTEEYCKAYYDGWNNCNMQHSQCKSELDDVVKCLINGMKFYYEDNEEATWGTDKWSMPVKHIIEVLEKQCEQKSFDVNDVYEMGYTEGMRIERKSWLEKQGESNLIEEIKRRKELYSREKEKAVLFAEKLSLGGRIAVLEELLAFTKENQSEKNSNKTEPKFKVGDWVTDGEAVFHITSYDIDYGYQLETQKGTSFHFSDEKVEDKYRLWTIEDAKDGDVLAIDWIDDGTNILWEKIVIFKSLSKNGVEGYGVTFKNKEKAFDDSVPVPYYSKTWTKNLHPATKEQHDLLFQKMKEAGYEWDSKNKELKLLISNGGDFESNDSKQKHTWSEDDEKVLSLMQKIVRDSDVSAKKANELSNWLNSLKVRF